MIIKNEYPPNIEKIKATFSAVENMVVLFTYGDVIYNPKGVEIPYHIIIHEEVHERQQMESGPEKWWDSYLASAEFRQMQEVEAYAHQYAYVKRIYSNRIAKELLFELAEDLSGPMYGNLMPHLEAERVIQRTAKYLIDSKKVVYTDGNK